MSQDNVEQILPGWQAASQAVAQELAEPGLTREEAERTRDEATSYFDLAWSYAGGLPTPLLVLVMGVPASGKTTLAEGLAGRLGLVHLSSDLVRTELAGITPDHQYHEAFANGLYAHDDTPHVRGAQPTGRPLAVPRAVGRARCHVRPFR